MAAGKPYLLNPLPNIRPQPRRLHEPGRDSIAVEQSKSHRDLIERAHDCERLRIQGAAVDHRTVVDGAPIEVQKK